MSAFCQVVEPSCFFYFYPKREEIRRNSNNLCWICQQRTGLVVVPPVIGLVLHGARLGACRKGRGARAVARGPRRPVIGVGVGYWLLASAVGDGRDPSSGHHYTGGVSWYPWWGEITGWHTTRVQTVIQPAGSIHPYTQHGCRWLFSLLGWFILTHWVALSLPTGSIHPYTQYGYRWLLSLLGWFIFTPLGQLNLTHNTGKGGYLACWVDLSSPAWSIHPYTQHG